MPHLAAASGLGSRRSGVSRRALLTMFLAATASLPIRANVRASAPSTPTSDDAAPAISSTPKHRISHDDRAPSNLLQLLALTPPSVIAREEGEIAGPMFAYADLQTQLTELGVDSYQLGAELPAGFLNALSVVPIESEPFRNALLPEFIDLFGFSALTTHRTLMVGQFRQQAIFFQGGLELDTLPSHWEAAGYVRKATSTGQEAWTNGENGEFSPDNPAQRLTIGRLNNALILDDGTLVFAPRFDTIDAIATLATDGGDSLADLPGLVEGLATLQDDTVAVMATAGEDLTADKVVFPDVSDSEPLAAVDAEFGALPAPRLLIMGLTAGVTATPQGEEPAHRGFVESRLVMESAANAELAAEIIPHRWETLNSAISRRPYADLLSVRASAATEAIAAIDLDIVGPPTGWKSMVWTNDLLPYAHVPDAEG